MTTEEINIAIAEACGWTKIEDPTHYLWKRANTEWRGGFEYATELPDYCNDLNAMYEAEKTLIYKYREYEDRLWFIVQRDGKELAFTSHATAPQRAEAFLRTLNLWKE